MLWTILHRFDQEARRIADRHYSRKKPGTPQFVQPGQCLVLNRKDAYWVTSFPFAQYVRHAWAGAWLCSAFRNEGGILSSLLIRDAIRATRHKYGKAPDLGMVTFVDSKKVRKKQHIGYCFLKAGFKFVGYTKGGLHAFQIKEPDMPHAYPPLGVPNRESEIRRCLLGALK